MRAIDLRRDRDTHYTIPVHADAIKKLTIGHLMLGVKFEIIPNHHPSRTSDLLLAPNSFYDIFFNAIIIFHYFSRQSLIKRDKFLKILPFCIIFSRHLKSSNPAGLFSVIYSRDAARFIVLRFAEVYEIARVAARTRRRGSYIAIDKRSPKVIRLAPLMTPLIAGRSLFVDRRSSRSAFSRGAATA